MGKNIFFFPTVLYPIKDNFKVLNTLKPHLFVPQGTWIFYTNHAKFEPYIFIKNIEREAEIARNEHFLLFTQCFAFHHTKKLPPILNTSEIVFCKRFQSETAQNLLLHND